MLSSHNTCISLSIKAGHITCPQRLHLKNKKKHEQDQKHGIHWNKRHAAGEIIGPGSAMLQRMHQARVDWNCKPLFVSFVLHWLFHPIHASFGTQRKADGEDGKARLQQMGGAQFGTRCGTHVKPSPPFSCAAKHMQVMKTVHTTRADTSLTSRSKHIHTAGTHTTCRQTTRCSPFLLFCELRLTLLSQRIGRNSRCTNSCSI